MTPAATRNSVGTMLASYGSSYDAVGQLTQEIDKGQKTTYTYDLDGQFTRAQSTTNPDESYGYDANGNRTSGGTVTGPGNQVLSDGTYNYAYDHEGKLIKKTDIATGDVTTYSYDFRNRLTDVVQTSAGGVVLSDSHYTYDVFNNRIAATENGQTVYTVYDGNNPWADYSASGQVESRYLFGVNTNEILARWQPGQGTVWYLSDHLGSIRDLVNTAGQVINHIDYNSFGLVLHQTNPAVADRFLYTGQQYDAATGLYYYQARYYDPTLGRFVSQDPLGLGAGANPYRYANNTPTVYADPSGLIAEPPAKLSPPVPEPRGGLVVAEYNVLDDGILGPTLRSVTARVQSLRIVATSFSVKSRTMGIFLPLTVTLLNDIALVSVTLKLLNTDALSAAETIGNLTGVTQSQAQRTISAQEQQPLQQTSTQSQKQRTSTLQQQSQSTAQQTSPQPDLPTQENEKKKSKNGACFPAGTPLRTPDGWRNIEDISVGDLVLSRDEFDPHGPIVAQTVEELFRTSGFVWRLRVAGRVIDTTHEHPFFVKDRGWVACHELQIGDLLATMNGEWLPVEELEDLQQWKTLFNVRVAELHTYFVGNEEWGFSVWAHNACLYRAITEEDLAEYNNPAATHINPRGIGGKIIDQIQGPRKSGVAATKYISASETYAGTARFRTIGVIEFDSDKLIAAGSGIVHHANVLTEARNKGDREDVENVITAQEVLITRGIPKSAITRLIP